VVAKRILKSGMCNRKIDRKGGISDIKISRKSGILVSDFLQKGGIFRVIISDFLPLWNSRLALKTAEE